MSKWSTQGILPEYLLISASQWGINTCYSPKMTHKKPHSCQKCEYHTHVLPHIWEIGRNIRLYLASIKWGYNDNYLILPHDSATASINVTLSLRIE
jgi:hypothetical protein